MNVLQKIFAVNPILNFGRHIITPWIIDLARRHVGQELTVLDIGCGDGKDLQNIETTVHAVRPEMRVNKRGIDFVPAHIKEIEAKGGHGAIVNIECQRFPFDDASVDIVIANQIFEHCKDIFWVCSEISRILKPGGALIVGVPNLGSWYNRLFLLFGIQPPSIHPLSAHVRGFTAGGMQAFMQADGYYRVEAYQGANMYPFPERISLALARIFPRLAVTLFFRIRRTQKNGNFIKVLETRNYETNFFRG